MNIIVNLVAIVLAIVGISFIFKLSPMSISTEVMKLFKKKSSLSEKSAKAKGKRKTNKLVTFLNETRVSLAETGRSDRFALYITLSIFLAISSAVLVVLIGYWTLVPTVIIASASIPFLYAKRIIKKYNKHVEEEIGTAMSIITSSYIRCEDIIKAVKENLKNIKYPVHKFFEEFIIEAETINTDTKRALKNLKYKVDDAVFKEWVDALIDCQSNRGLKVTLEPIVRKYTDVILVNNELETLVISPKMQYYSMVGLTIAIIPLLYFISSEENDWFSTLMFTTAGKIILGIAALFLVLSYGKLMKVTKPIKYKG